MEWWVWMLIGIYIAGALAVLIGSNSRQSSLAIDALVWPLYLVACVCE